MDVAVVAHSDWLVVVLVDTMERVDWLCGGRRGGVRMVGLDWLRSSGVDADSPVLY